MIKENDFDVLASPKKGTAVDFRYIGEGVSRTWYTRVRFTLLNNLKSEHVFKL